MEKELFSAKCGCVIGFMGVVVSIVNIFYLGWYSYTAHSLALTSLCLYLNLKNYKNVREGNDIIF